jgi:putative membrane protein
MQVVVALHVFPPAIFAVIHGARFYRWRGILMFVAIIVMVGNVFENVGVRTGFPFGHYYFTDLMGPKIFAVPIMLGLAYVGMGYLSWTLARMILGDLRAPLAGVRIVTLPVVATFIMVAWDLSMDPVWATVLRAWVFPGGGAYFGVPLSNFAGWYLTVYSIYQLFALYSCRRASTSAPLPPAYWRQPVLFYAVSAAGNLLLALPQTRFTVVAGPTGTQWRVSDISATCALVTIFTMGAFALLAWVRLRDQQSEAEPRDLESND